MEPRLIPNVFLKKNMHIQDIFKKYPTTFSFEFFPPKTDEAAEALFKSVTELESLKPSFVSVTYGAGGSTRDRTHALVERIQDQTSLNAVPHLTCIEHDEVEIEAVLLRYAAKGVSNLLALRGDPPQGSTQPVSGHLKYAHQLVALIQKFNRSGKHPDPRGFGVGVAGFPEGHPATPNRLKEIDYLKAKVDAGADAIITQLFFDNRDFFDFRERCVLAGIRVPIIAGIMPITSASSMKRMAELALGARYPAPLLKAIARCGDDLEAVRSVGLHWATEQCRDLLDQGARGIHFYTLNHSHATQTIYKNLGARDSLSFQLGE